MLRNSGMKKGIVLIAILGFFVVQLSNLFCTSKKFQNGQEAVLYWFQQHTDSLIRQLDSMDHLVLYGGDVVILQ